MINIFKDNYILLLLSKFLNGCIAIITSMEGIQVIQSKIEEYIKKGSL